MKAILYKSFQSLPVITQVPDPAPSKSGVVIEMKATGLCRSDWHGWMGHDTDIQLPHVPGHEFAGIIQAVGSEVRNWKVGDRDSSFCLWLRQMPGMCIRKSSGLR